MKKLLLLIPLLLFLQTTKAQDITDDQWTKLITSLEHEQWKDANDLSKTYLDQIPAAKQDSDAAAALRYMYLYSESGLMNLRLVTKDKALKNVAAFAGHSIILPAHPISLKNAFNSVEMVNEKTDSLFITATNKDATSIFSFEYIVVKTPFPLDDFKKNVGKFCRLKGNLKAITVEGNFLPRFRLIIDQAEWDINQE